MKKATADEMRRIEQAAVEAGDSYAALMERAGREAAVWILRELPDTLHEGAVCIVCGKGNNGGDGFVIARRLCERCDAAVTVVLAEGEPLTATASEQYARLPDEVSVLDYAAEPYLCGAAVTEATLLVDALYGIGFHGELPDCVRSLVARMNAADGCKVAVDMPSGVCADTDAVADGAFAADYTLTFTAAKCGQSDATGCGRVQVLDIGIPEGIVEQVLGQHQITEELVRGCFRPRPLDSHKGTFGHLLAIGGSYGMAGAAMLCVRGALRSGVGLVTAAVPRSIYPIMAPAMPEAVFLPLNETASGQIAPEQENVLLSRLANASAVVCGCGIGRDEAAERLVLWLLRNCRCPLILDADGINAIEPHTLVEETVAAPLVLTPHPGEMARLLDISVSEVQRHREEIARRFADEYGVTLVLKGHRTLVASPGQPLLQNDTGNPGMATGGSGDVLAGIIGSLAAQGMDPYRAALCGVYLHGAAGDAAAAKLSQHSMLPSDIIAELGDLFLSMEESRT